MPRRIAHDRPGAAGGDADIASVAALFAEPARSRIALALLDGRALPATRLAREAGIAASTASWHLSVLLDAGALRVEQHGRHRFYRLAGPDIAAALEALAALAPTAPVRSLRDATQAAALRAGRMCYDHLAGRLGVSLFDALIDLGVVVGHDGSFRPGVDRLSARGTDVPYALTDAGRSVLQELGVDVDGGRSRRPLLGFCIDWTEQRHHLGGWLGAALAHRLFDLGWVERAPVGRAVALTDAGRRGLRASLGRDVG